MKRIPEIKSDHLMNKIFLIRGEKVMLDRDLAELYDVKPQDFMNR